MLIMFKVKNYASFKEEAILDMRATSYVQHPSHVVSVNEKLSLLKTTALYGANASGKSNFISAMFFFEAFIFSQFINKDDGENIDSEKKHMRMKLEPFALTSEVSNASEFDIMFHHNGKIIQYGFECTPTEILNEWFYIDDKKVYERSGLEISLGSKYQNYLEAYTKVPSNRLYIAVLDYFLDDDAKLPILSDFISFFAREFNVYTEILLESTVKGLAGIVGLSKKLVQNDEYREKVAYYLRQIDVGIQGLDVKIETVIDEETGEKRREHVVRTIHNKYDSEGHVVGQELFDLRQESTGTLRFLAYIQNIINVISRGGVFIVDEMTARLHPLMAKMIVDMFASKQNRNAQVIFTTHDISLLNNNQFRRDEVVFVDKNERGESKLYSLSDLRVREDASFSKDYLQGKYGAIPIFNYDVIMGGDING